MTTIKLTDSLSRWFLMTFLPLSPKRKSERQLALLWKSLQKEKPRWYDPVTDRLTKDFVRALLAVKDATTALAQPMGLSPGEPPAPSVVPALVGRLAESLLAKSRLSREQLTFAAIYAEVSPLKGADYRGMQHLLQTRLQSLPKSEGATWEKALPSLEALVHLVAFDWSGLFPLPDHGSDCVEALEDLAYVLEPVMVDSVLETLVGQLFGSTVAQAVASVGAARFPLLANGRLRNVIRAVRAATDHPFRQAVYQPPTISSVFREAVAEFESELQNHRNEGERLHLAAQMSEVFGDRVLAIVPDYNEETSAKLVERRLPALTYVGAIKVLHNVHEAYHGTLLRPLFQGLQTELDFLSPDAKGEFQRRVDDYYSASDRLEKFLEDLRSPTYSQLAPVMEALRAPFLDQKMKLALKKPIEETNRWADDLSHHSARQFRDLHVLLEKYLIDLDDSHPRSFTGGSVLVSKHPQLVTDLKACATLLKGLNSLLRQLVADTGNMA